MAIRHLTVSARRELTSTLTRITVTGHDLEGFDSPGPADHVKVFFPDPATHVLRAPEMTPDGMRRPEGVILSRDFTPRAFRQAGANGPELDIDFVIHGSDAPASAFASTAEIGAPLAIGGPRGSVLVPSGITRAILIADETAMPALARWLEMLEPNVEITAILDVADDSAEEYFTDEEKARAQFEWLYRTDGFGQLDEAVRSLGKISADTYVWAAGEATSLIPVRRHLRRELGLDKSQVDVDGYWKRGIVNRDHHDPIDETDPED